MNQVSFGKLLIVSLSLSLIGSLGLELLQFVMPTLDAVFVMLSVIVGLYIGYLLLRSRNKAGRMTSFLAFSLFSVILLVALVPIEIYSLALLTSICLIRSFFFHRSFLGSLADGGLLAIGVLIGYWVLLATSSWFLTLWSFFLIQSLFIYIPKKFVPNDFLSSNSTAFNLSINRSHAINNRETNSLKNFDKAYHLATEALARLSQGEVKTDPETTIL